MARRVGSDEDIDLETRVIIGLFVVTGVVLASWWLYKVAVLVLSGVDPMA